MTIEERANKYVDEHVEVMNANDPMSLLLKSSVKHAYINGAKEQKWLDIEKACDWLSEFLCGRCEDSLNTKWCNQFKQYMENDED